MRFSYILENCFTKYKIEKWNEKKQHWEFYYHSFSYFTARYHYKCLVKKSLVKGIFRLVAVLELDEIKGDFEK